MGREADQSAARGEKRDAPSSDHLGFGEKHKKKTVKQSKVTYTPKSLGLDTLEKRMLKIFSQIINGSDERMEGRLYNQQDVHSIYNVALNAIQSF